MKDSRRYGTENLREESLQGMILPQRSLCDVDAFSSTVYGIRTRLRFLDLHLLHGLRATIRSTDFSSRCVLRYRGIVMLGWSHPLRASLNLWINHDSVHSRFLQGTA